MRRITARPAGCLMGVSNGCLIHRRLYLYSSALYAIGDPCPRSVCVLHIPLKETPQIGKRLQAGRGVNFVKQGEKFVFSPCNPLIFRQNKFQSMEISVFCYFFCRFLCPKSRWYQSVSNAKVALLLPQ